MKAVAGLLDAIVARKREEITASRAAVSLEEVEARAAAADPPRDLAAPLRRGFTVIAEIKPASPVAGMLRGQMSPSEAAGLARQYVSGGAGALSVLTDASFFGGSPALLQAARAAVAVPVLRKDFIVDRYQVYESRAMGADGLLLIAALLDEAALHGLLSLARDLGMAALVEVHKKEEIDAARSAGARIIGINNRDLLTFGLDVATTLRLRPHIPPGVLVVSESGITGPADVARVRPHVDAVLVGTALMASADPEAAVRALVNGGGPS